MSAWMALMARAYCQFGQGFASGVRQTGLVARAAAWRAARKRVDGTVAGDGQDLHGAFSGRCERDAWPRGAASESVLEKI